MYKTWVLFAEENASNSNIVSKRLDEVGRTYEEKSNEHLRNLQKLYEVNDGMKSMVEKLKGELVKKDDERATVITDFEKKLVEKEVRSKLCMRSGAKRSVFHFKTLVAPR